MSNIKSLHGARAYLYAQMFYMKSDNADTERDMSNKKYPRDKKPKSDTVRIPAAMADAVENFLDTDRAKGMGFRYKIDVITAAVRDLLIKYGYYEETGE